jgi:hypothetical protein
MISSRLRRSVRGAALIALGSVLSTCSTATGPRSIEGTWAGSNDTYREVTLTLSVTSTNILGTLRLRNSGGAIVFDGPVNGPLVAPDQAVVMGAVAPSAGGGTVTVDARVMALGLTAAVTSTWLPSSKLILHPTS